MNEIKQRSKSLKLVIQGLPIAAAVGSTFLLPQRLGQQLNILIVLIWIQTFFVFECFLTKK